MDSAARIPQIGSNGTAAGRGRRLLGAGARFCWGLVATALSTAVFRVRLWLVGARVGSGMRVRGWVHLHVSSRGTLTFGDRLRLNSGYANNPVGPRLGFWVGPGALLTIGNNVAISNSRINAIHQVVIEDDAMIGAGCTILDSDIHPIDSAEQRAAKSLEQVAHAPVVIGKGAFIGLQTVILKGVHVGAGAVIGAGSVQTKSIPHHEIWAGAPSRRIRAAGGESAGLFQTARRSE